jgi:hypothetical protein
MLVAAVEGERADAGARMPATMTRGRPECHLVQS